MKQRTKIMNAVDGVSYQTRRNSDEDEEINLTKIRPVDKYIEAQVQEGDTLQAIALKYHCNLAEVKRINNIHKDNEIFARRTIKLPINPFSILTENILPVQVPILNNGDIESTSNVLLNQLSNENTTNFNDIILNSRVRPSVAMYTDAEFIFEDKNEDTNEESCLIPSGVNSNIETMIVNEFTSKGADFGLKWYHMLVCVFIVAVVLPIVYIIFYKESHDHVDVFLDQPKNHTL